MSNEPVNTNEPEKEKKCRWSCEYWCADPDGEYCGHPQALEISDFGINLNRMLGVDAVKPAHSEEDPAWGLCKDRKLWLKRSKHRMPKGEW